MVPKQLGRQTHFKCPLFQRGEIGFALGLLGANHERKNSHFLSSHLLFSILTRSEMFFKKLTLKKTPEKRDLLYYKIVFTQSKKPLLRGSGSIDFRFLASTFGSKSLLEPIHGLLKKLLYLKKLFPGWFFMWQMLRPSIFSLQHRRKFWWITQFDNIVIIYLFPFILLWMSFHQGIIG